MDPAQVWNLPTRHLGQRVLVYESIASTNDRAMELAGDPANDGVVVLAHEQTAGRGQYGRRWQCNPGDGVLMSVLLFPPPHLRRPVLLAAWAAVAVCSTIREITGLESRIKWPNDVLLHDRKVCGVLIEQGKAVVAGIGLNVNQGPEFFAAAGLPEGGSLASLSGSTFDVPRVARRLIEDLDANYDRLLSGLAEVENAWQRRLGLVGVAVEVECSDRSHRGILRTLSFAEMAVETAPGPSIRLRPETVRHIRATTVGGWQPTAG